MYQPNHFLNQFCKCTTYNVRPTSLEANNRASCRDSYSVLRTKKANSLIEGPPDLCYKRESAGAVSRALCCPTTLSAHA